MIFYILKRTAYSTLIILGVLIITFILFRVAAGDPAATVLGKNPSPREIEDLRDALGSNKPLFFGKWKHTEQFSPVIFDKARSLPSVTITGETSFSSDTMCLSNGNLIFKENFSNSNAKLKVVCRFKGEIQFNEQKYHHPETRTAEIIFTSGSHQLQFTTKQAEFTSISFYKKQNSFWRSQLLDSINEVVSFRGQFPYISFFNFGNTLITREPIRKILWNGMWPSLSIMIPVFLGELILGIVLSLIAAAYKDTIIDKSIVILSIAGMSISYLVFIIFGQWYLGYYFDLFPVWGYGELKYIWLPIIIGIISGVGGGVRFYRTVFINELNREYLRTALAKGCSPISIYFNHLLRNAMIPIITRTSSIIPFLFTGSLLLESFFGIPGLGYAGYNALANSDLQLVKALVVLSAFLFVTINLLTDIAYAWADPRIRLA